MTLALDFVLIILFAVSALIGYLRGFARSAWKFVSLGVSAFLSHLFGDTVGKNLFLELWQKAREGEEAPELLSGLCGYVLIFTVCLIVMGILGILVKKIARSSPFSTLDSFLGLLFGAISGLLLVFFVCVVLSLLIELRLTGEEAELLKDIAENSVIFRFFCEFSPFDYLHIKTLFH